MSTKAMAARAQSDQESGTQQAGAGSAPSADLFHALADAAPVMIWMSDATSACTFLNASWLEFVGREMEQEIGNGWAQGVYADDFPRCFDLFLSSFNQQVPFSMEYRLRRHDGEYRWILDKGAPWYEPCGAFGGYIRSCVDITEKKEIEEEFQRRLAERTEQLTLAYHEMESFSYSVSHDLRAPLRSIISNLSFLVEDHAPDLKPEAQDFIERAKASATRMDALVQGILQLSRLSRKPFVATKVDMSTLAAKIGRDYAAEKPERALKIQSGLSVNGDEDLLGTVLDNLIGNAFKYDATCVEVGREGDNFFVRDNGIGFDPRFADKLFQPFERLHSPRDYPGTGIGLTTAKRIVERHGGKIWAESQEGQGATFYFTITESPTATSPNVSGT